MSVRPKLVTETAAVFCANLLVVPTGLLAIALVTWRLSPADYGLFDH